MKVADLIPFMCQAKLLEATEAQPTPNVINIMENLKDKTMAALLKHLSNFGRSWNIVD